MMHLSSKNDDSSLCYDVIITLQILKIYKFDVISLIINQCDSRRPKGGGLWWTQSVR